jgi:hypothetical protein
VKQLNFMLDKDLGFRTHDIIKVPFLKIYNNFEYFEESKNSVQNAATKSRAILDEINQKLDASPLITHFVRGGFPSDGYTAHMLETSDGRQQNFLYIMSTEEWFKVFEIKLLEGRLWNSETDKSSMTDVIVNESALKQLDLTDYNVVGVVSDFHTEHLSKQLMPTIFIFSETGGRYYWPVIASFVPGRRQEVIEFMKNLHDELVNDEFEYSFIEDEIAKMYGEDKKVSIICTAFTGMAILISMLGLLGVSLFDIRQRRKEIAIRKIHGAMMKDIISLLLKKYFVLLGLAFVVSTPVALFVIMKYLEGFAYKAPVSWWLFAVALVATVVVSLLTLIWQAYKAGLEPPAEVVKS